MSDTLSENSCNTAESINPTTTKIRKRYIKLDAEALNVCLQMFRDGKSVSEITKYASQSNRNIQKMIQKYLKSVTESNEEDIFLQKRGRKPQDNRELTSEIAGIVSADPSLTLKGMLFFLKQI
jgi:hypothetical protein